MRNSYLRSVIMTDVDANTLTCGPCESGSNYLSIGNEYDERQHTDADNVAILDGRTQFAKENMHEPMSAARHCCFAACLILCFGTAIVFLWLLPCNEEGACPAFVDRPKSYDWFNNYTKIELKGGIHVVNGWRWEKNLIFLYRGDVFFADFRPENTKRNGVISLVSSSGTVSWFHDMTDEPVVIDCALVDVDRNGRPDCLVMDEYGELGAINPLSGQWHWRFKERSAIKVHPSDFPLILPDLDNDGVMEILVVTSATLEQRIKYYVHQGNVPKRIASLEHMGLEHRNCLIALSGRNGKPIGERFKIHECDVIKNLHLDTAKAIVFTCLQNNSESQRSKTLPELFALFTNKSLLKSKIKSISKISQHHYAGQRATINDPSRNIYSLNGRELLVENFGKCPDCNVTVILTQNRNGKGQVLQNFTQKAMYGMVPVQLHFKEKTLHVSGFVMKFWKWSIEKHKKYSNDTEPFLKINNPKINNGSKNKKQITRSSKANGLDTYSKNADYGVNKALPDHGVGAFDYVIHKSNPNTVQLDSASTQRHNADYNDNSTNSPTRINSYKMHTITESVVSVLFIGSETRIENTSQSNIVQFCWNDGNEIVCQPDVINQDDSMIIADLDHDGCEELVTYTSTFVQYSNDPQDWHLVTYVRLMRLESELSEYYHEDKMKRN